MNILEVKNVEPKSWCKYDIYWLLKSSCFDFFENGKYGLFLSQKSDGKMIFTDYWKVLVLNFSVMGNMVFFWVKKLMENVIFTDYWKVLVLNLSVVRNTVFFWVNKLMERWYSLAKEKFLFWPFQWWEIRYFFQS